MRCSTVTGWSAAPASDGATGSKGTALSTAARPNDLWCADYKGAFMLADRRYCYPRTISDYGLLGRVEG